MAFTVPSSDASKFRRCFFGPGASALASARLEVVTKTKKKKPPRHGFIDNRVTTALFTALNFLPRFLFGAFSQIGNMYFGIISALMCVGYYTPLWDSAYDPWSTLGTLTIVLSINATFAAMDDLARHRADHASNTRPTHVVAPSGAVTTRQCLKIRVGDVVLVQNGEEVPADMVLLCTSEEDGLAYVETAQVDGETNLKLRTAIPAVSEALLGPDKDGSAANAAKLAGGFEWDHPNDDITSFNGKFIGVGIEKSSDAGQTSPTPLPDAAVGRKHMMLRGCKVKNTKWVLGLVAYTGEETKVRMNASENSAKQSNIMKLVNRALLACLALQLLLVLGGSIYSATQDWRAEGADHWYLGDARKDPGVMRFLQLIPAFYIMFSGLVPISLYVSIEVCNFFQQTFINADIHMYDEKTDTPAVCRSANLCQELGQIEYIFSDKTGTLTQNVMRFKCCIVGDTKQGDAGQVTGDVTVYGSNETIAFDSDPSGGVALRRRIAREATEPTSRFTGEAFFLNMAINHTVAIQKKQIEDIDAAGAEGAADAKSAGTAAGAAAGAAAGGGGGAGNNSSFEFEYQGASPDEVALVEEAARNNYRFVHRNATTLSIERGSGGGGGVGASAGEGKDAAKGDGDARREFQILGINGFNSTRKRSSVVVHDVAQDTYLVYCKGADNVMLERAAGAFAAATAGGQPNAGRKALEKQLADFARTGLRTLVFGSKTLSEESALAWAEEYKAAANTLDKETRKALFAECAAKVESDLSIDGCSAIEDKLQEGISDCISSLASAGIKLWVLTGDKVETAINIGYSCAVLVHDRHHVVKIEHDLDETAAQARKRLGAALRALAASAASCAAGETEKTRSAAAAAECAAAPARFTLAPKNLVDLALVITGPALTHVLADDEMRRDLLDVGLVCSVVIGCRVSPKQKALVVAMVKDGVQPTPLTLAIGDGANDCPMIQTAHVGVGIKGPEGHKAANSADFAIAQFRFLKRLLLVHGRFNYRRMAKVVLYSFYKNAVLVLCSAAYQLFCGASGTPIFEAYLATSYNIFLFTGIVAVGIFDRDISIATALRYPELYMSGRLNMDINIYKVMECLFLACMHAFICANLPFLASSALDDGEATQIYSFGTLVFTCLLFTMIYRGAIITSTWNKYSVYAILFSLALYILFLWLYPLTGLNPAFIGTWQKIVAKPFAWLVVLGSVSFAAMFDLLLEYIRREFFSTPVDWGMEIDYFSKQLSLKQGTLRKQLRPLAGNAVMHFGWMRRQIELTATELTYSSNGLTATGTRSLVLEHIESLLPWLGRKSTLETTDGAKAHTQGLKGFKIQLKNGNTYEFLADSHDEATEWLVAVQKALEDVRAKKAAAKRKKHGGRASVLRHGGQHTPLQWKGHRQWGDMLRLALAKPEVQDSHAARQAMLDRMKQLEMHSKFDVFGGKRNTMVIHNPITRRSSFMRRQSQEGRRSSASIRRDTGDDDDKTGSLHSPTATGSGPAQAWRTEGKAGEGSDGGGPEKPTKMKSKEEQDELAGVVVARLMNSFAQRRGQAASSSAGKTTDKGDVAETETAEAEGIRRIISAAEEEEEEEEEGEAREQKNRPDTRNRCKQQTLPSCQFLVTPLYTLISFFFVGLCLVAVGLMLYLDTLHGATEYWAYYGSPPGAYVPSTELFGHKFQEFNVEGCQLDAQTNESTCYVDFWISGEIEGPVSVYYRLENVYQNYLTYLSSYDFRQLHGMYLRDPNGTCSFGGVDRFKLNAIQDDTTQPGGKPVLYRTTSQGQKQVRTTSGSGSGSSGGGGGGAEAWRNVSNTSLVYHPCGLIAHSMFNDIFNVDASGLDAGCSCNGSGAGSWDMMTGQLISQPFVDAGGDPLDERYFDCRNCSVARVKIDTTKAANPADLVRFENPDDYPSRRKKNEIYLDEIYPDLIDADAETGGLRSPRFVNWMQPNAFSSFKKFAGVIDETIPRDTQLRFKITSRFPVWSFNGLKAIVLQKSGTFGGQRGKGSRGMTLQIFFIVAGCAVVAASFVTAFKHFWCPRALGSDAMLVRRRAVSSSFSTSIRSRNGSRKSNRFGGGSSSRLGSSTSTASLHSQSDRSTSRSRSALSLSSAGEEPPVSSPEIQLALVGGDKSGGPGSNRRVENILRFVGEDDDFEAPERARKTSTG